jgi:hypothetical protein
MKFVFTREEVAAALQQSVAEFEKKRPRLEAAGFPKPISLLEERWPIMAVMNG